MNRSHASIKSKETFPVEDSVARSYAFSHSYRKTQDRAPLDAVRPPLRYKRLEQTRRITLPGIERRLLQRQTLSQIFSPQKAAMSSAETPVFTDLSWLSTLLYFNLGGIQIDLSGGIMPLIVHRPFPSPGSLYASELSIYLPERAGIAEGLYHYHGLHHDLSLLRGQEARPALEQAIGQSLADAEAVLLVGSDLWRIVQKYANFGYRLVSLEAGHLIANLLIVASALGLEGRVHYLFDDDALLDCLGVPALQEAVLAVVPLYRRGSCPPLQVDWHDTAPQRLAAVSGIWRTSSGMAQPQAGQVCELEQEIRKESGSVMLARRGAGSIQQAGVALAHTPEQESAIPLPPPAADETLLTAYQQRNSGLVGFHGLAAKPTPVPLNILSYILTHIFVPYHSDLSLSATFPADIRLLLFSNHVQNLAPVAYEALPHERQGAALVPSMPGRYPLTAFGYRDTMNTSTLGMVWGIVANYDEVLAQYGTRGYRIVNMQAGFLAQRLCLLSAAQQLFARPFCAFQEQDFDAWLHLEESSEQIIYTVLSGYNRVKPLRFTIFAD